MTCIFCKIIGKEIPAEVIYDDDSVIAFLDIQPNNKGHTLVVPKAHHADLVQTPDDVLAKVMSVVRKLAPSIMDAVNAEGFNTIINTKPAAGQVIFHTHVHIIPRFSDDGLKHWPHKQMSQEEFKDVAQKIIAKLG